MIAESNQPAQQWYVMRTLFGSEMRTQRTLNDDGIRTFLPMCQRIRTIGGRRVRVDEPAIGNMLFVYSDPDSLSPYISSESKFQYTYRRGYRADQPLTVPVWQMEQFISAVTGSYKPLYFLPSELNISAGTRIRIHGGLLDGIEGRYMRVKGCRNRRLVIELPGTLSVAVEVTPDLVEVLQ